MKGITIYLRRSLLATLVLAISALAMAQDGQNEKLAKEQDVKTMIDAHRYVFKAQSAHPSRGRTVQLNSEYDLRVSGDTLRSYLPYFGRAYSAPIGSRGGGYDFTTTQFDYNQNARRKGGWDIVIRPKDVNDVREMYLTVFQNGSASLRVFSNNREPISYHGFVEMK